MGLLLLLRLVRAGRLPARLVALLGGHNVCDSIQSLELDRLRDGQSQHIGTAALRLQLSPG